MTPSQRKIEQIVDLVSVAFKVSPDDIKKRCITGANRDKVAKYMCMSLAYKHTIYTSHQIARYFGYESASSVCMARKHIDENFISIYYVLSNKIY